jgi:hypothetical protein
VKELIYERKGMGQDWFTHHWFCEVLRSARQQLANRDIEEAERTIAFASLFALERMNTPALAASLGVLAEVLEEQGVSLDEYLNRGRAA